MQYPRGEIVWLEMLENGSIKYIITSKPVRDYYYLYEAKDGVFVKFGKNKNPKLLEIAFAERDVDIASFNEKKSKL